MVCYLTRLMVSQTKASAIEYVSLFLKAQRKSVKLRVKINIGNPLISQVKFSKDKLSLSTDQ